MRQVSIGPPLRIGAMSGAIVLLANVAVSLAIESNGIGRWLAAPIVGAAAAIAAVLLQGSPSPSTSPLDQLIQGRSRGPILFRGRYVGQQTVTTAVVVSVLVVGVGGFALSAAARYGMGWVTGNEHGPNRLVSPVTANVAGLSVTVDRIEQTPHFTRVSVIVENGSMAAVSLPLDDGNCRLIAGDGTTRRAQSFRSDWNESLEQGAVRTGVVTFGGHLPAQATRARMAFVHLFGSRQTAPRTFVVANLQLLPPS